MIRKTVGDTQRSDDSISENSDIFMFIYIANIL